MIFWIFFSYFVSHSWGIPMMKITGLSHLFKWENLHNWWLTKYCFAPLYIYIYQNLFKKGALDTSWHLYRDASFLKQLVNSHLTYLYQKNQQVKPVGAHIIWGYKCFANGPGADLLLFDCIKYGKYYSAIFCLLEVTFKIHLAQKTSLSMGMTPLGTAIIKPERKAAWLW